MPAVELNLVTPNQLTLRYTLYYHNQIIARLSRNVMVTSLRNLWGAIHSTKTPTGPTGKSGPPQKVDPFFWNFSSWTELIHWVLDRNFRKFWLNVSRPWCNWKPPSGDGYFLIRLLGMCRWMGSHFHDWIDYNGVAFSIELLEWGRTFSDFLG